MARIYEHFEPAIEWGREGDYDTLTVHLPDFEKEQIKVQGNLSDKLRISGVRPLGDNKWSRFSKEIPLPSNDDPMKINSKFEGGILHIKLTKMSTLTEPQEEVKPPTETPKPENPTNEPEPEKSGQEEATQEFPSKINIVKQTSTKTNEQDNTIDDLQKTPEKENEQSNENVNGSGKSRPENYKQVLNLVVPILLAVVVGLFATNAIRSHRKSKM